MERPAETNTVKGRPPQSELNISLYRLSPAYDDDVNYKRDDVMCKREDVTMCQNHQCSMFSPHPEKDCGGNIPPDFANSVVRRSRRRNTISGTSLFPTDSLDYSDTDHVFLPGIKSEYSEIEANVIPGNKEKYSDSETRHSKEASAHEGTDLDTTMLPETDYEWYSDLSGFSINTHEYMDSKESVFPGNKYECIESEGSAFPETHEHINSDGFVLCKRKTVISETPVSHYDCSDTEGRVFSTDSDEHMNLENWVSRDGEHVVTEEQVFSGTTNSGVFVLPGIKHEYSYSEECDFPGNKYLVQAPVKSRIRSQFDHLWDASASEIEGMESGLHMWMNESGSTGSSLADVKHKQHSAMWMTCQSLRGFENSGFAYPDHLDGVRDGDFSFYTDDDVNNDSMATKRSDDSMTSRRSDDSMTSRRSDESVTSRRSDEDSEMGKGNTIGRFATRRLSQTLLKMGVNHDQSRQTPTSIDSSVRMTNHVKTHVSRDYMQSFVTGMVVVEVDGNPVVVVADQINQCIKAFYIHTEGHHDWMRLCNWPSSITTLECRKEQYIVVNIPFPHHIDIVRVTPRLQIVHKIKMLKEYFCVASLDNDTLVASSVWEDPPTIDILKLKWRRSATLTVIRSIVVQKSFLSLCNDPMYVNTTNHRRILLLDWESSGFVCIDEFGALKFKYAPKSAQQTIQPHSVTCDSRDFIYVTDAEQNRVVQLAKNGDYMRDVLTVDHGLDEPRHVVVDSRGNMYVSQFNGDVKVFALNPPLVPRNRTLFDRLKSCFSK